MRSASSSAISALSGSDRAVAARSSAAQNKGSRLIEVACPAIVTDRLTGPTNPPGGASITVEQGGELLDQRAAELFGIHDRDRAGIIAGDVMADADRRQLDRRLGLDPVDHLAQMPFEIAS